MIFLLIVYYGVQEAEGGLAGYGCDGAAVPEVDFGREGGVIAGVAAGVDFLVLVSSYKVEAAAALEAAVGGAANRVRGWD